VKLPGPDQGRERVIDDGSPVVDNLEPGKSGVLKVPLNEFWQDANVLYIEAFGPDDRLITRWSWAVKSPEIVTSEIAKTSAGGRVEVEENANSIVLTANGVIVTLSKDDGTLKEVSAHSKTIPLTGGPKQVSKDPVCIEVKHAGKVDDYVVEAIYNEGFSFIWNLRSNGLLDLDVKYQPENDTHYAGITFSFPEKNIKKVKWMGNGPYRVWKNRMKGGTLDVWENEYNNTITGYSGYVYPEFKGYYSDFYWAEISDGTAGFKVFSRSNNVFLRMLTPGEAPDPANTAVKHPPGDISFLHGIPAIGTKFNQADNLGPQSSRYVFRPSGFDKKSLNISMTFDFR